MGDSKDEKKDKVDSSNHVTDESVQALSSEVPHVDNDDSPLEPSTKVLDIEYDDFSNDTCPETPNIGVQRKGQIKTLHALGDLHGWAPGLINYLIIHQLASIEIDGNSLGTKGRLHSQNIMRFFGRHENMSARNLPSAGLSGRPGFDDCINGEGHGTIRARWIAEDSVGFIQVGDVFDRSDHSELAAEILRQLTIDAPDRVFTLIGNHEQFMLEGDFVSWQLNEARNGVTNHRDLPPDWEGKHLRFLATEDVNEEQRCKLVFDSYRESIQVMFLTQAAVQQRVLGIEHGLEESDIDALLTPGWGPYQCAPSIALKFEEEGLHFPGAIVALVMGDTLFHHAEPNHKKTSLHKEMNWGDSFSWINYIYGGGDIKKTPHAPLLWSRGASVGSYAGTPSSQTMLDLISVEWPGLYRIVHGHTPTVTSDGFNGAMEGKSTTVSYLAEAQGTIAQKGKAARIRVYNVDEGMAPVYYSGDDGIDNPLRIPIGLRIASKPNRMKPILSHGTDDKFLIVDSLRDVREDTRKFWRWKSGENRSGLSIDWESLDSGRWVMSSQLDGVEWLVETTEEGQALLSRRISEYDILRNVVLNILIGAKLNGHLPKSVKISPPRGSLHHLNHKGGAKHFTHLQHSNTSWRVAVGLEIVAVGFSIGKKPNSIELYVINGTAKEIKINFSTLDSKTESGMFPPNSVTATDVSHDGNPFAIHLDKTQKPIIRM